jgi:hypothetical protein
MPGGIGRREGAVRGQMAAGGVVRSVPFISTIDRKRTHMTTATAATTETKRAPARSRRKTALVAGAFYLITFISVPTVALYGPVKNQRHIDA